MKSFFLTFLVIGIFLQTNISAQVVAPVMKGVIAPVASSQNAELIVDDLHPDTITLITDKKDNIRAI